MLPPFWYTVRSRSPSSSLKASGARTAIRIAAGLAAIGVGIDGLLPGRKEKDEHAESMSNPKTAESLTRGEKDMANQKTGIET